ncbi:21177_t:CDS:2, partial [Cetraspora pellucida]
MSDNFKSLIKQAVKSLVTTKSTDEVVTIEIVEHNKRYNQQINVEQSLSEFRSQLLGLYKQNPIGRICLYKNMLFVGLGGGIISQDDEKNYKLGDILHVGENGKIIKFNRSLEYIDDLEIIKLCKLEYGIKMSEDGPVELHENNKAFEFITQDEVVDLFHPTADIYDKKDCITRNYNYEITCQKNLIANLNVSTNLPWSSLSTEFKISYKRSRGRTNYNETSMTFDVNLQGRAKVIMANKVRPSKRFEKAVDDALKCSNPVEQLKNVCNEYGEFWAREIILGGKIQIIRDGFIEVGTQTKENVTDASVSVNIENVESIFRHNKTEGSKFVTNSKESRTNSKYIGGDSDLARKNVDEWIESLKNYTTWRVVEYRNVVSIFEILEDNLRKCVLDTLGKNILYAQVDQCELKFVPNQKPENEKGTFSVRVIYTTDSNSTKLLSTNLLIHRFRKSGNNKPRKYSLKIGWIIIGIPNGFNYFGFEGLKEFEVKFSKDFSSNDPYSIHDIYDEYEKCKTYPLVTCALKISKSLQYDPLDLKIVTGIHFHHKNTHLQMCINNYDLANGNLSSDKDLLVQYCITQRACTPVPEGKLCDNKGIFSTRGNKTRWTCDQPAFVSLYQQTCGNNCIPGLFKITPDNAVFKSFNGITFKKENPPTLYYI